MAYTLIRSPTTANERIIKRVIGTGGDTVIPRSHTTALPHQQHQFSVQVPPGHIWIEGDNAENSIDSNAYGAVPISLVTGKAKVIVFPINKAQWLHSRHSPQRLITDNTLMN